MMKSWDDVVAEDEDEIGLKDAFSKGMKWIILMNMIFGIMILVSILLVHYIETQWFAIQLLLFLNFITFWSNMIVYILGQRTILFAFRAEGTIDSGAKELNETVKKFKDAGITAKKLSKLEPLVDELSVVVDNVNIDKLSSAMEHFVTFINKSNYNKDYELRKPDMDDMEE